MAPGQYTYILPGSECVNGQIYEKVFEVDYLLKYDVKDHENNIRKIEHDSS